MSLDCANKLIGDILKVEIEYFFLFFFILHLLITAFYHNLSKYALFSMCHSAIKKLGHMLPVSIRMHIPEGIQLLLYLVICII